MKSWLRFLARAGGALLFTNFEESPTARGEDDVDAGVNLFGGLGAKQSQVRPFGQLKVTRADHSDASIAFGVRF